MNELGILVIRIVTGEELFANASIDSSGRLVAKNPLILRAFPPKIEGGPPSYGFMPFPPFADHDNDTSLSFEPLHIVYTYVPSEEYQDHYKKSLEQNTTKGIITG